PGSVFKTVTLSAALENDPSIVNRTFNDTGKITFPDGTELNNYMKQAHGNLDLQMAYRVSSNVVFGTLAMEMGNPKLKEVSERFGFNSRVPGIGISISESRFPALKDYEVGNIAQSGIGQACVLSTPMQMAIVAATVANDGVLMEPKLVNKIV
ncbi:penicillin-binding transpeptidase domain-containing protein, partial [Clostridium perfringens]|uniref:penicillin-binding transpeptidase domain-containing protein n=1 Tax=Clostridium perfringens TaxID=1502 RepID=UPI002ACD87B3